MVKIMIKNYKEIQREVLDYFVNSDLKKCPWCDKEPNLSYDDGNSSVASYLSLECDDCYLSPSISKKYHLEDELDTLKYLIEKWNDRKNG